MHTYTSTQARAHISEVLDTAIHDKILKQLPGVAGMPEPRRAEALIYRVQNRTHDEGITDIYELAATYWIAISRGHIFNDGNKRTAFFVTMFFLYRNGIKNNRC